MTTALEDTPASTQITPSSDPAARLRLLRDRSATWLHRLFAAIDARLAVDRTWAMVIALAIGLQVLLTLQHRPWLDEWQALQIALQSPRLTDLLTNLRYEGHPPLWYLILRGINAVIHNTRWVLPVAALLIAIPVQATILLAAPFSRAERAMIALSEFVLFEFLTISRSLTLGVALMIAVAALWKHRRVVWLPIALLPLCDFLFGVISVIFVALRWRQGRMQWPLALVWAACGLLAGWTVRPMPDISSALLPRGLFKDAGTWLSNFSTLGLPMQFRLLVPCWNSPPPLGLGGFAVIGFGTVAWLELRRNRDFALVFGGFVALTWVFSVAFYQLSIRHLMDAAALLIVLVWIAASQGAPDRTVWWRTWLLVAAACGIGTALISFAEPFDTTPEAAALINRMGLHDRTWVAFPHAAAQGVAAINGMQIERLGEHCSEDFVRWNAPDDHRVQSMRGLQTRLAQKVAADGRFYLLTMFDLPDRPGLMHRIAFVRGGYDGQDFLFYEVGGNAPYARPHGQPCAGPHPPLPR